MTDVLARLLANCRMLPCKKERLAMSLWPPQSPDLKPCIFCGVHQGLGVFSLSSPYHNTWTALEDASQKQQESISEEILAWVCTELECHHNIWLVTNGAHIKYLWCRGETWWLISFTFAPSFLNHTVQCQQHTQCCTDIVLSHQSLPSKALTI